MEQILLGGADPQSTNFFGQSPIHVACSLGCLEIVKVLCNYDAYVDQEDQRKETGLHIATRRNNFQCVKMLLQFAANPNLVSSSGNTPLHVAAKVGSLDCARALVEYGCSLSVRNDTGLFAFEEISNGYADDVLNESEIRELKKLLYFVEEKKIHSIEDVDNIDELGSMSELSEGDSDFDSLSSDSLVDPERGMSGESKLSFPEKIKKQAASFFGGTLQRMSKIIRVGEMISVEKVKVANLGDGLSMYYDEKQKKWCDKVNKVT